MFARMFRWVMTTPFGSAVAPDVKMISAVSSAVSSTGAPATGERFRRLGTKIRKSPDSPGRAQRLAVHDVADQHDSRVDDVGDAQEKGRGRAVVDRDEDDALEQATPERDDPLRPVLAPEHDRLPLDDAGGAQPGGERARRGRNLGVAERPRR